MKREYPESPIVAVGVIIRCGDRIVLIQRDREPARGKWTFPGGAVELGEALHDAARREAQEETGLEVAIGQVAAVVDTVVRDADGGVRYHYVIIDYQASVVLGRLHPGSDVQDACWAGQAEIRSLPMTEKARQLALELLQPEAVPG